MSDIQNLEIDLDLKQNLLVTVNCKQFDNLNLKFNIWNNGLQADLSNYRCRLKALKQDQIPLIQNTDITISGNVVTVIADQQLTTTSGVVTTELQFIDKTTGEKKSTFNLNIKVFASVLEVDRTISKATITLLQELDTKLDQIEDIGDVLNEAKTVKAGLESDITSVNTLKSNLDASINTASSTKTALDTTNTNAISTKTALDSSVTNGNSTKVALDTATTNAETKKQEVIAECVIADSKISAMQAFGDVTQVSQDITNLKSELQTARGSETNLDARLDKFDTSLSEKTNKNWIINGNLDHWQRGTSLTNPISTTYLADRFLIKPNITGAFPSSHVHSRELVTPGEIEGATYFYRLTCNGSSNVNANDAYFIQQAIENGVRKLSGANKKLTVSFKARSSILNKKLGLTFISSYGTGGTPSTGGVLGKGFINLTSDWKKYTLTIDTESLTGKTFGTNNDDYIRILFYYAYGSTLGQTYVGDPSNENLATGTIDIAQVKVEIGDKATPFVPRLYGEEDMLCKRYYQKNINILGVSTTTGHLAISQNFPVNMRNTPSIITGAYAIHPYGELDVNVTISSFSINTKGISYANVSSNNLTVGKAYGLMLDADSEIY